MSDEADDSQILPCKHLTKSIRLQKIIEGLKQGKIISAIAKDCGVSEKTIDKDLAVWRESGGFDQWLLSEFLRLHEAVGKEDNIQTYKVIADLLKKRLKEQIEQKIESTNKNMIIIKMWQPDDTTGNNSTVLPVSQTATVPP